jgi:VIT1/CCC1 family predicted Fe2+/Mn2+ transporter
MSARPVQAAFTSAASFAVGAVFPLAIVSLTPAAWLVPMVGGASLAFLGVLGGLAARAGGARVLVGTGRVVLWGALAMALTAAIGKLFGKLFGTVAA